MFLLNSCLSLFSAAGLRRLPFFRSYGKILPSSLAMLLPSALGFSPHPPVSVYGTGNVQAIAAFLDGPSTLFATLVRSASRYPVARRICQPYRSFAYSRYSIPGHASFPCPHSSAVHQCRNINLLSIGYAFRPRLRSRLPQGRSALPWIPWIFGHKDSHLVLATHSGILSSGNSTTPYGMASALPQCSPTDHLP